MVEQTEPMVDTSVRIVTSAVTGILDIFKTILIKTGTTELLMAGIIFTVVMTVIVIPLRGGVSMSRSPFAGFIANQVNKHRSSDKKDSKSNKNG